MEDLNCGESSFQRIDKEQQIKELIAQWINNPSACIQEFNGTTGGKSLVITNWGGATGTNGEITS